MPASKPLHVCTFTLTAHHQNRATTCLTINFNNTTDDEDYEEVNETGENLVKITDIQHLHRKPSLTAT